MAHGHALSNSNHMFIYICLSFLLPRVNEVAAVYETYEDSQSFANDNSDVYDDTQSYPNDDNGVRLTREYHLRQGALRGLIVQPSRKYDLQAVEMFLGIPYAAPPVGNLRFMPPGCRTRRVTGARKLKFSQNVYYYCHYNKKSARCDSDSCDEDSVQNHHFKAPPSVSAAPWPGVKKATRFAPVCPQTLPPMRKDNPPSRGRQNYLTRMKPFLTQESEDCLYLNIYVPFREQKPKKFPVLVFIHGDSFEWSSGNPYDGRVLASYGNIMVITINFRLGILGFMKPSLTEHDYGNNGLLDQLAALQWIKDNIEDLNGDPHSVTLMGHGTGAACISFLMLSPISNGLFHRAILMSGSALSDWAMTRDPTLYTMQVAQSLGCNPSAKNMMSCLQNKPLAEIKKVQILARKFETPLGPVVAGSFIPNEPEKLMESFPSLLSKYQLLTGVSEMERYHDFGVIELDHGILDTQRDEFISKYAKLIFDGGEEAALKEVLKQYAPSDIDPERWTVETNREVVLNIFSDARTLAPMVRFANFHCKANRQSYFYVFGHNSVSTEYAPLNKSVHGEEMPYILGVPLGGTHTHFHAEYTVKEKLLSEVMMRLWTNFVKLGTPNTQSMNEYYSLDQRHWTQYNVEWPEYNFVHQSYLKIDIPPYISSLYRSNFTQFWSEYLANKMRRYVVDPLYEFTPAPAPQRPKSTHRNTDSNRKPFSPRVDSSSRSAPSYGKLVPYVPTVYRPDTDAVYREIQSIKRPSRPLPGFIERASTPMNSSMTTQKSTIKMSTAITPSNLPVKTSATTITLIIAFGILFLAVNIGICTMLYFKKRELRLRERAFESSRQSRAEIGEIDVIGQKSGDKNALQTFKNGCSVFKSMSITKIRRNSKTRKKSNFKPDPCKTPKSDDSGGFRERFQLRRHLSTSTLDANTKVRDWIANEVMHRCTPSVLQKSSSDLNTDKPINIAKPFTRSEELLPDTKKSAKDIAKDKELSKTLPSKLNPKTKTSEKTTSTSALGSHSSIGSNKKSISSDKHTNKSSDSLKSKGTESVKSKKVSVAIDATPAARTNSILKQEPIELTKSFDSIESKHSRKKIKLQKSKQEDYEIIEISPDCKYEKDNRKTFTNTVTLSLSREPNKPLKISHKHSLSDPVTDVNYDKLKEKIDYGTHAVDIPPPVVFRNDINVTSRDESVKTPLTAAEALLCIQRRNFPKVLPDLPKAQKRLSLQPAALQTFRNYGSSESQSDRKVPPQPPPRTTTLERRLAYKNSKPLSSFDASGMKKITESNKFPTNYENIDNLSHQPESSKSNQKSIERIPSVDTTDAPISLNKTVRDYPKVIIASSDIPSTTEPKIPLSASRSQADVPANVARVRLPDDFHSTTSSLTSFSSFCSDDDLDIEDEEDFEDKLIQELVGGLEENDVFLDSKGPATAFEQKLEIVPVKINPGHIVPKSKEDYISISDLHIRDVTDLEQTARIKPNFGLNKLQKRSESIHRPTERAVKVKQKRSIKPSILNKSLKSRKSGTSSALEHSNSGSSNDTETSTGTVREVK